MKKNFLFIVTLLLCNFIVTQSFAQSTIVIDNTEAKPVPVKLINPTTSSPGQVKLPFTEISTTASGVTRLMITGPKTSDSTKVIEYILGNGVSSTNIQILLSKAGTTSYRLYIPATNLVTIPSTSPVVQVNTYSGLLNIAVKTGETVTFIIDGSGNQSLFVSGYTLSLK